MQMNGGVLLALRHVGPGLAGVKSPINRSITHARRLAQCNRTSCTSRTSPFYYGILVIALTSPPWLQWLNRYRWVNIYGIGTSINGIQSNPVSFTHKIVYWCHSLSLTPKYNAHQLLFTIEMATKQKRRCKWINNGKYMQTIYSLGWMKTIEIGQCRLENESK